LKEIFGRALAKNPEELLRVISNMPQELLRALESS